MPSPAPASSTRERRFAHKRPHRPLHLNMTALVSVSLLLLIFFVYRSAIGTPRHIALQLPSKNPGCCAGDCCCTIDEEKVFTVILGRDKIYSYWKLSAPVVDSFSYDSLKTKLLAHQYRSLDLCEKGLSLADIKASGCWDPIFVVKPRKECRYGQFMACLNELTRMGAARYAIADEYQEDRLIVQGWDAMAPRP